MHFNYDGKSTMGFCAEKGKGMGWSLKGHTWGNPQPISDPTVKTMMALFGPAVSTVIHFDSAGVRRQRRGGQQTQHTHQHKQSASLPIRPKPWV